MKKVFGAIAADHNAIIASSTSGFTQQLREGTSDQIIVAHPYNPVYLLPAVELCGADNSYIKGLQPCVGMKPVILTQIDALIGDRLLEAVWRKRYGW